MLMLSNRINQWLLSSKVSLVVPYSLMALNVSGNLCSIKDNLHIISCNLLTEVWPPYLLLYSLSTLTDSLVATLELVLVYEL